MEYREKLALEIRRLRPRTVIVPSGEARHPDHFHAGAIAFDASFLAGLRKLDPDTAPHRPYKVIYSSHVCQYHPLIRRRYLVTVRAAHESLFATVRSTALQDGASDLFPDAREIRERLAAIARFYGNLIGAKYGEPFVVKETMRVDDVVSMPVRTF